MKENTQTKKIATEVNPTIAEVLGRFCELPTLEKAQKKLDVIRNTFVTSLKIKGTKNTDDSIILWIRGYLIDENEKKEGAIGNFAEFYIEKAGDGKFLLAAEKIKVPAKFHPQRLNSSRGKSHPNWGHPSLRQIQKRQEMTYLEADNTLKKLKHEYPETAILNTDKLYLIVFESGKKPPFQKYVFDIVQTSQDKYIIEFKENYYKKRETENFL